MTPPQPLLGARGPLIQPPLAGIQGHALAAAVSHAGALPQRVRDARDLDRGFEETRR